MLDPEMPSSKRQKTRDLITVRFNKGKVITIDREDYKAFSKLTPDIFPKIYVKLGYCNHHIISMNEERRIYMLDPGGSRTSFSFNERLPEELWTLSALTYLDLDNTSTGSIPSSIQSLQNLQSLSLCDNKINHLPPEIGNLRDLEFLDLSNNDLEGLPPEIGKLTNLCILNLENNKLKTLPLEIGKLASLEDLHLRKNKLKSLPPEIGNLENLDYLFLSENELESLPTEIGNMVNLEHLRLSKNKLEGLPSEIGNLVKLDNLQLDDNNLKRLPLEIGNLVKLDYLQLENNSLKVLPPEIGNLAKLCSLHLDDNNLKRLPPEIGNLAKLDFLHLEYNSLEELPPEIGNLAKLNYLQLEYNSLEELPPEIGNLVNLSYFNVESNQLEGLPPEIGNLVKMTTLVLADNGLEELPPEIGNLVNLERLELYLNPLRSLPPSIGNLSSLEYFDIMDTSLEKVPEELWNLSNLGHLDMRESSIMMFPSIQRLQKLHTLYIDKDLTEDEAEFMTNLIMNTPSLCFICENLVEYPKIKYATACNRFKLRNPFSASSQQMILPFLSQLWPRMLANGNQAFEHSKTPSEIQDRVGIEPHDAVYKLLTEGLDSFVQMLYARKSTLHTRKLKRNIITIEAGDELISIDEEDFDAFSSLSPDVFPRFYSDMLCYGYKIIEIHKDDEDRRITYLDLDDYEEHFGFSLQFPDKLWRLTALEYLDLSGGIFTGSIPSHIQMLQNLKSLFLNRNHLTHLPPEIGKLVNLESLELYHNSLTDLPPEIGNLKNLKELDLGRNFFQLLPPCIGNLSNLEIFKMKDSNHVDVPIEFWNLRKLCSMKMSSTSIGVIPPSIERLQNLQELDMVLIEALPEEFGKLVSLKRLNLWFYQDFCPMLLFPFSMASNLQSLEYFKLDSDVCSSKFDVRQLGFLRSLPKLTELCVHIDLTDDGVDFMKNLILDTPSLRICKGAQQFSKDPPNWDSPKHSKIKYALLHNHFKHRTCLGRGTKDMSTLVYKLWPKMLSNASRAFYPKKKWNKNLLVIDHLLMDQHDAVYQLLKKGRGSFVGMLRDQSSSNHK